MRFIPHYTHKCANCHRGFYVYSLKRKGDTIKKCCPYCQIVVEEIQVKGKRTK